MRLKPEEIERICKKVLQNWKSAGLVKFKSTEDKVLKKMVGDFTKNLQAEDQLYAEAEKLFQKMESQTKGQDIDRHKMLAMIRKQLAKEKGFIL